MGKNQSKPEDVKKQVINENMICATESIGDNFVFQIVWGDVLLHEMDAVVLPLDHELRFSNEGLTK